MASEIRVNSINNRSGLGTVTIADSGLVVSGIVTATTFSGNVTGNATGLSGTPNITVGTVTGNLTGNVTGNINSTGVSTFSGGIVVAAGTTAAPSITPTGDSNTGIFFPSADTIAFGEGGAEAARFDSNLRLLVGTSSPRNVGGGSRRFEIEEVSGTFGASIVRNVNDSQGALLSLGKSRGTSVLSNTVVNSGDTLGGFEFYGADGSTLIAGASLLAQVDGTPGANDMPGRIVLSTTSDGVSSPTERFRVDSNGRSSIVAASDCLYISSVAAAGVGHRFIEARYSGTAGTPYSGTTSFEVLLNGNVKNTNNSYGQLTSDERFKQDITDASSQWDDIKNIRITNYRWKSDPTGPMLLGPIAQELQAVSPGLIDNRIADKQDETASGGLVSEGDEVLSFKASILYMKAVKALQEAMERIETLEAKVAALESA